MNEQQTLLFFYYQREIFGICPCCGEFFRLSDCKIYKDAKAPADWFDKLNMEERRLDLQELKLEESLEALKSKAREKGRKSANKLVKKVDKVFYPLRLNPDDAKVLFHPVDYIVFDGMKDASQGGIRQILLLDAGKNSSEGKQIQRSIREAIEKEQYEWITFRINPNGDIDEG